MKKIKVNIDYNKKIAKKFHDTSYYEASGFEQKKLEYMQAEKESHKTDKKDIVTKKIKYFVNKALEVEGQVFNILQKIYDKNKKYAFKETKEKPINCDLLTLLADENLLMVAYKKVRKNKGAMTKAYELSKTKYESLTPNQKSWINKTVECPDKIDKEVFLQMKELIKNNQYPWGTSRQIYVDKPGRRDAKRPITIPPFMDKVVQEAITMVLMAIYEPYFEAQNCSLGFRPNKGVHDAIVQLTSSKASANTMALEGDIKSAYDRVNREKFLEILGQKIKDRQFLNFLKKRLDYEYFDMKEKTYIKDPLGLPQGGVDSPYMWNIYMMVFDEFVVNLLKEETDRLNVKAREKKMANKKKKILTREKRSNERKRLTIRKIILWFKKNEKLEDTELVHKLEAISKKSQKALVEEGTFTGEILGLKVILKEAGLGKIKERKILKVNLLRMANKLVKEGNKIPSSNPNRLRLRFIYVRYADDWIIITNMKKYMLQDIKTKLSIFLRENLYAELSDEKTLITDIRESHAHFLGYEISTYRAPKISKYKKKIRGKTRIIQAKTAGNRVFATPDRERLINRLYMKGYCDKKGFPREIGFLTKLEDFSIIERYNAVLTGIALYYAEFIKNPKRNLSRWIYIIRYSCIKTLAQKHKTTIRKIFRKYSEKKKNQNNKGEKTIMVKVVNKIGNEDYYKIWKLKTLDELIKSATDLKRRPRLNYIYWKLEKGESVEYTDNEKSSITNDDFYEKLNWINIRTQSSFDLPCSICGSDSNIQMHHLRHVRKNKYSLIDKEKTWEQAMSLRNRKQIPICRECHINLVHKGNYGGTKLSYFVPKVMYDNRIITIESHITKEALNKNKKVYAKNLMDKGWKLDNTVKDKEL